MRAVSIVLALFSTSAVAAQAERLQELLDEGRAAIAAKDFDRAIDLLEGAARVDLHEEPNDEPYLPLAEARCRKGEREAGRVLLDDFACMLDIEIGERRCFAPEAPTKNPALSTRCFEVMCGEVLTPAYASPTKETKARVKTLRREMQRVERLCAPDS